MTVDIDKLTRPFPPQAIKQRQGGGGNQFDYVEGETVIRRLNDATGNNWNFRIIRFEQHGDLYIAIGELEIPGHGSRQGIGVQRVSERGGEDLVKGAATDALKKCATLFGVALELYGPDLEAGEVAFARDARPREPAVPAAARSTVRTDADPERDPNLATLPQINAIFGAGKRNRDYDSATTKEWIAENYGKHVDDLTKAEASAIIDRLQEAAQPAAV